MRYPAILAALVASALLTTQDRAEGQRVTTTPPSAYDAISDRVARRKPLLPGIGAAGAAVFDPIFGSHIWRLTDGKTRPGSIDRSYRTPSGTHQNAWSASGSFFYVVSTDGTVVPYAFDAVTERARRIDEVSDGDGGLVLRFYIEPHFSYVSDQLIYGSVNTTGSSLRTIEQFDFSTRKYTTLVDLDTVAGGLSGTYVGGVGSSGGPVERVVTFFGGTSQDRHHYVMVFDKAEPTRRHLLDTFASTLDGTSTNIPLRFALHHAFIDRSGRYVLLYPTGVDRAAPRNASPAYVWDLSTARITELGSTAARSNGHDAYGYATMVNQDCCTTSTWDAAQWQFRDLASPLATRDLISPILAPPEVYLADHPSWNNARADRLLPYITALYRYGANDAEWRAWDDEIIAVQTDAAAGQGAAVWRLAHHRSDVSNDSDKSRIYFWYTPRPNVSPDGRWALFTSNWEKTLGRDPAAESGGSFRQDVFLVALKGASETTSGSAALAGPGSRTRRSPGVGSSKPRGGGNE
jgi:hypothetical protein